MIEAEQLQYKLNSFQEPLEDLSGSLALEAKKERIDQLELNMEEPGFWDNVEESQNVMKEVKSLKGVVEEYDDLKTKYEDIETLIDMAEEDEDADLIEEATALMDEFEKTYEELRISTLLTGEYDKDDAILTLHAGQVEQSLATGQECYTVCSQDGQERKVMEQKFLIILMGMKQGSNLLL